jgi:peptidoglycan/LPS O-acetylase OafA/YrhL/lysophospholipase L1-like esterase
MPALDGIRAIAVIAVLLYHAELTAFQGGFLGVDIFFALSGFLITRLLVEEYRARGVIALTDFYVRRARRLLPALLAVIVFVVALTATLVQDAAHHARGDAVAALLYLSNWWFIVSEQSYFDTWGRPPLLQHLWSLAIEEQFYVLWPLIAGAALKAGGHVLVAIALAGSLMSTAWMAWLAWQRDYPESADASRAYFGSDTHSMGLLFGAALGAAGRGVAEIEPASLKKWMPHISATSLVLLTASFYLLGEHSRALYLGGFLAVSIVTIVLVYSTTYHANATSRLLSMPALRWIGDRSYGLYLWHWPIFAITRPGLDLPVTGVPSLLLRLGLTVLVAQASYVLLETPFRKGAISRRRMLQATAMACTVFVASFVYPVPVASNEIPKDVAEAMGIVPDVTIEAPPAPVLKREAQVTVLGDSVLLGARKTLESRLAAARVDAAVGRQARDMVQRIRQLKEMNLLGAKVVLHLGNNGYVTEDHLRTILALLDDRERVILVTAAAPRRWVERNNALIERIAADHPNTVVADWSSVANDHPEYFVSDQVHLTGKGQRALIDEIFRVAAFSADEIGSPRPARTEAWQPAPRALPVVRLPQPRALDAYWDAIAQCETGGDWQTRGDAAGGLSIDILSWHAFGGAVFAPTAADASREQQIAIANRMSTQGWSTEVEVIEPVGFGGFKCAAVVGEAALVEHEPQSVVIQTFAFNQSGAVVRDLQKIVGAPVDGVYGSETWLAHLQYLKTNGLSPALAPR